MAERIEFTKAWRFYHVGDVIEPPGALRQHLLRGVSKPAKPGALLTIQGVVVEKAPVVPKPAEAALADPLDDEPDDVPQIEITQKRRRRKNDEQQNLG